MRRLILLTTLACSAGSSGVSSASGQWRYMNASDAEAVKTSSTVQAEPAADVMVTPKSFMTMKGVSLQFGDPDHQAPAVGQPPITRWYYPGYTVYFEHDRVITSVLD